MEKIVNIRSKDGVRLASDYYEANGELGAILTHGIMSERTEAGLYTTLAESMQQRGISALTLDLRAHGDSEGQQQDFFLSGAINDICSAIDFLINEGKNNLLVISASFSGGLAIRAASLRQKTISHLLLLNPRLDYTPWVKDPDIWKNGALTLDAQSQLNTEGYVKRKGYRLGPAMVNELICFNPSRELADLNIPILFIHGTEDTAIPIESSKEGQMKAKRGMLIEIPSAQHGFTDPITDDPRTENSQKLRRIVIDYSLEWIDKNFIS